MTGRDHGREEHGAIAPAGPIAVAVVSSADEFERLRVPWKALLASSAADTLFLDWDWMWTWWRHYGAGFRLHVLVARDGHGDVVGIAPLKLVPKRHVAVLDATVAEFIGYGADVTPEYLDFIVRRGLERPVTEAILRELCSDPTVKAFDLRPFSARSRNFEIARRFLEDGAGFVRVGLDSNCPIVYLPGTWDEYVARKSRNYRKKIGEYERRVSREIAARRVETRTAEELDVHMRALVDLHRRRWRGRTSAFRSREYIEFHREFAGRLLESDRLRLSLLYDGDRAIAALYCFRHGRRWYYYQSGRDPDYDRFRPGLLMIHWAIRRAIEERMVAFDLLRGREAYKYRWAEDVSSNLRLAFSKKPVHWVLAGATARVGRLYGLGRALVGLDGTRERRDPSPEGDGP